MQKRLALLRRSINGEERLWIIWWIWGAIALAIYVSLYIAEDELRASSSAAAADLLAVCKLFTVCLWATVAWRCSANVDTPVWTMVARAILVLALGATAATL